VIECFPYAILIVDAGGQVVYRNAEAERLLSHARADAETLACCSLFGCHRGQGALAEACLTDLATSEGGVLPELQLELATATGQQALWVTAAPLAGAGSGAVLQLRPDHSALDAGGERHLRPRRSGAKLRIATLGETAVESAHGSIRGDWLSHLPGQLLKYLVVTRDRLVTVDEIGEALWHEAGYAVAPKVRYYIHALRRAIEPERGCRERSSLIISRAGSYRLDPDRVQVDVDEFQARVHAGLELARAATSGAAEELTSALVLYRGDFLSDLPYAEWAMSERDRLHNLACSALQTLGELGLRRGDLDDATRHLAKLASLRPYDEELHRQLMQLDVQRGHLSDALRRYEALQKRMTRVFGRGPQFTPADLTSTQR
jgi:DNA-binding SARP family transcriptional activator